MYLRIFPVVTAGNHRHHRHKPFVKSQNKLLLNTILFVLLAAVGQIIYRTPSLAFSIFLISNDWTMIILK